MSVLNLNRKAEVEKPVSAKPSFNVWDFFGKLLQGKGFLNYGAVGIEFFLTAICGMVSSMIVVRHLSQVAYGQFAYAQTTLSYLLFWSIWSMTILAPKELNQNRDRPADIFAAIIQTRLRVALLVPFLGIIGYFTIPERSAEIMVVFCLGILGIFVNCFGGDLVNLFSAFDRQRTGAMLGVLTSILNLSAVVLMFLGFKMQTQIALSLCMLFSASGAAIVGIWLAKKHVLTEPLHLWRYRKGDVSRMLKQGAILLPGRFCVLIYTTIPTVLSGWMLDLTKVALLRVGLTFAMYVTTAALLTQRITNPRLLRYMDPGDEARLHTEIHKHIFFGTTVAFLAILETLLIGKPLMVSLYGARYETAYAVAVVVTLQLLGMSTVNISGTLLVGRGRNWEMTMIYIAGAVAAVVSGIVLIPVWGVLGAAASASIAQTAVHFVALWFLPKSLRFVWVQPARMPALGLVLGASVFFLWGAHGNRFADALFPALVSTAVYLACVLPGTLQTMHRSAFPGAPA